MDIVEHAVKNGGRLKAVKRKLGIGKNQIFALSDQEDNVTTITDKIVKVADELYRDHYSSRDHQANNGRGMGPEEYDMPPVKTEEVKNVLEAMKRGNAHGGEQVIAHLFRDGGQTAQENLASMYA